MQGAIDVATADVSSQLGSLHMGSGDARAYAAEGAEDRQNGTRSASIGPDERRRLMVATMSPEDIILCVDVGPEMNSEWAGVGPVSSPSTRMRVVQGALCGFVRRKASFNVRHRFALCALGDGVRVMRTLTSDVRAIMEAIECLQPEKKPDNPLVEEKPFDFSELLGCIAERFPPPAPEPGYPERGAGGGALAGPGGAKGAAGEWLSGATTEVRPVVRAVVVFGRSYKCPLVPEAGKSKLLANERFFLDCVYLHRKPSEDGVVCQQAWDLIASMESSAGANHSYFLESGHNAQRFNVNIASLLAHPVQRDYQEVFFEKMDAGAGGVPDANAPAGSFKPSASAGASSNAGAGASGGVGAGSDGT